MKQNQLFQKVFSGLPSRNSLRPYAPGPFLQEDNFGAGQLPTDPPARARERQDGKLSGANTQSANFSQSPLKAQKECNCAPVFTIYGQTRRSLLTEGGGWGRLIKNALFRRQADKSLLTSHSRTRRFTQKSAQKFHTNPTSCRQLKRNSSSAKEQS